MQEGILSLMQLAKTSAALARLSDLKVPFHFNFNQSNNGWRYG